MDEIKRLHYFDHQFLRERDFSDEQKYHMTMRRLHNELLHTWGIAEGLELKCPTGDAQARVSPGVAMDGAGNEIVLAAETETPDLEGLGYNPVWITIRYGEEETDRDESTGATGNTRVLERPEIEVSKDPPGDASVSLILGRVYLNDEGKLAGERDEGEGRNLRRSAGVVGGNVDARSLTLEVPGAVSSEWPALRAPSASQAELAGSLTVTDSVGIGTSDPKRPLHVAGDIALGDDGDGQRFILHLRGEGSNTLQITCDGPDGSWEWGKGVFFQRDTGNVGIGTGSASSMLAVSGGAAIGAGYAGKQAPASGLLVEGNVGIGTDAPRTRLQVAGDIALGNDRDDERFVVYTRGGGKGDFLQITCDTTDTNRLSGSDKTRGWGWDWGTGIFLKRDTGNVGIGTYAAHSKLAVSGSAAIGTTYARKEAPENGLLVQGTVGIGTDKPRSKLCVVGNAAIGTRYGALPSAPGKSPAPDNGLIVEGKVGIGTSVPDAALHVNGTVKAAAFEGGGVAPVGTMAAYGGADDPPEFGWLICDGRALIRAEYTELFEVIGTSFGAPDDNRFSLPDLRGRFLRGVDHGQERDPDAAQRGACGTGGNAGDEVGSLQNDALGAHTHALQRTIYKHRRSFQGSDDRDHTLKHAYGEEWITGTEEAGENETRPKNVYVNFIIRAK